ncbi:phospholipase D-like domain-containing protein [Tautonia plasticadhaerens]|uniref:phospholipase D n=1 Tax=Tautonia plasticadhaerens TaxID=2527974 RepID=A0A518GVX4_9BACT|nr:phospholipase D-like domain-containing protein [Tautonia plasticadhaerens]QDV32719.1 Phospholipase D precursor [Tautonia plasticadhaerens]
MPDASRIDALLSRTLDDFRLSRGERQTLGEHLDAAPADHDTLAFWRNRAFALARSATASGGGPEVLDWLEGVEKLLAHRASSSREEPPESGAFFTPGDSGPRAIAGLFGRARTSADVCVFTITDDRITSAILDAHRRGVAVRIISDDDKAHDLGSDIKDLRRAGIPLHTDRDPNHMHHKFAVFDRTALLTGSYNWTRGAAEHNFENFVITADPVLVSAFLREFDRLWSLLA